MIIRKEENIEKRSSFGVAILKYLILPVFFLFLCPSEYKGVLAGDAQETGRQAEIIPIEPGRVMPAKGKKCIFSKNSSPLLFLLKFRLSKRKRMKSVLIIASSLVVLSAQGKTAGPADSLKISKDISLDEVVVTATKVAKGTPVAYSELTKDELNRRNDGQGIPFLILQSPSVIMTSDAGTGIGYSGFRIRGTDANRINITVNGVPVNDSESHTVFWVNMPDFASSVDNIQIQRGAGTSTNGAAAFGATVAMQTQKSELKPYAEYSVSAGSFGTVKNMVKLGTGLLQDHFVFDARYSNIQSDGYIDRAKANMHSYFASAAYYGVTR